MPVRRGEGRTRGVGCCYCWFVHLARCGKKDGQDEKPLITFFFATASPLGGIQQQKKRENEEGEKQRK
jgi:hypothetical protein